VEKILAVDATGLVLFGSGAWRADHDPEARRDFAQLHVLSGTTTRATLAVRVTRGTWHDATQLGPLSDGVPDGGLAEVLTGDGAYWSRPSGAVTHRAGLQLYFSPKENALWWPHPEDAFECMTRFAMQFSNRLGRDATAAARRSPGSRRRRDCSGTACGVGGRRAAGTRCSRERSYTTCGCSRRGCLDQRLRESACRFSIRLADSMDQAWVRWANLLDK